MGKECVIYSCTNRDTDKQVGLKFHRIPRDEPRRTRWLKAINRTDPNTGKDWVPGDDGARICSDHFIEGKSDDPESPDYVPSVNLGYRTPLRSLDRYSRASRRSNEKGNKRSLCFDGAGRIDNAFDHGAEAKALMDLSQLEQNEENKGNTNPHEKCITLLAEASLDKKQLTKELERLQLQNSELKQAKVTFRAAQLANNVVVFYTGLPSRPCFMWLVNFMQGSLPNSTILESADMLLLVLMKLRLNAPHKDLAIRFGISETSVSTFIDASITKLAEKLKFLVRWPEKDDIMRSRPKCFKDTYPRCVSVIDCTEVFIECPGDFTARSATYSNYKHTNTVKYLVSITPSGSVSFISRAFGGKASDKVITMQSGYLDNIKHGDVVMADRGFLISDELASRGAELVIPAFTRGKAQLSARDVETSRKISNVRIHVERAMERLKNFRIFRMPLNMVPHSDSIMTICAGIMNLHPCLVQ